MELTKVVRIGTGEVSDVVLEHLGDYYIRIWKPEHLTKGGTFPRNRYSDGALYPGRPILTGFALYDEAREVCAQFIRERIAPQCKERQVAEEELLALYREAPAG